MSAIDTTAPAPALGAPRRRLLYWAGGGAALAAVLAAGAIAFWPASTVEKAHDDGVYFGESVAMLYSATSPDEADAALANLHDAALDARDDVGDDVANHIADQQDALARAPDLTTAVDDLTDEAEQFRTTGSEAAQAFYEGVQEGLR
jgi:hypothetical protein